MQRTGEHAACAMFKYAILSINNTGFYYAAMDTACKTRHFSFGVRAFRKVYVYVGNRRFVNPLRQRRCTLFVLQVHVYERYVFHGCAAANIAEQTIRANRHTLDRVASAVKRTVQADREVFRLTTTRKVDAAVVVRITRRINVVHQYVVAVKHA